MDKSTSRMVAEAQHPLPTYDAATGAVTLPPDFERDPFGAVIGPASTSPVALVNAELQCSVKLDAVASPSYPPAASNA